MNKQKIDWEKEFNYNFPDGIIPTDIDNIKKFISQLLKTQREEIIKEIEGILKDEWEDPDIRGSRVEDTGTNAVLNPVVRNQLRKEIRERLKLC